MNNSNAKKYNFDFYPDRKPFHALKVEKMSALAESYGINMPDDVIPMWVADMDFQAPDELRASLHTLADHGIFGYANVPHHCARLAAKWLKDIHNYSINDNNIIFSAGVVYSICTALLALTEPGDEVLIIQPVYTPLSDIVHQHGRCLRVCHLVQEDDEIGFDIDEFKSNISENTRMLIFCNPHNPSGKLWTKQELSEIAQVCIEHDIIICSDDIHADIIYAPHTYTAIASLDEKVAQQTITCYSPSKTFNLGGGKISYAVIDNPEYFSRMKEVHDNIFGPQPFTNFGITMFETVYSQGHQWYRELLDYLKYNRDFAIDYVKKNITSIKIFDLPSTYLLWMDCRGLGLSEQDIMKVLLEDARVFLSRGSFFGEGGDGFMRLNLACPHAVLQEALERISKAFKT